MRRKRSKRDRRKFNLKKFLRDYPIVPIVAIIFVLGVWVGFGLGRKSVNWKIIDKPAEVATIIREQAEKVAIPKVVLPTLPTRPTADKIAITKGKVITKRPKTEGPRIAFVIDDIGYGKARADLLFSIDRPITLAILPQLAYSKFFSDEARKHGFETILHLPLQPDNTRDNPGVGVITVDMKPDEVLRVLRKNLESVPGVVGANNHMGSRATRDRGLMYLIAKELRRRNLFFLDSLTHPKSEGYEMARLAGIPSFKRTVFIDNQDDLAYVTEQIQAAARTAKKVDYVIAIGHIRKNTLNAIKNSISDLESDGIQLVSLSELL